MQNATMAQSEQTYATHTRWFPPFHYFVFPVFLIAARVMAIAVQDRVIRLEERLRMRELLPADLQPRVGELKSVTDIKKAVTQWRGDDLRA